MTNHRKIRVMLVDDQTMVRSGLAAFLLTAEDMRLVGEVANGQQAIDMCGQVPTDVVLMDLGMPGMDGTTATRSLRKLYPQVQVIVLTSFQDQEKVQAALQAGAVGYLLKDISASELACSIRAAYAGRLSLAPEGTQPVNLEVNLPVEKPAGDQTGCEREALASSVQGLKDRSPERLAERAPAAGFHNSSLLWDADTALFDTRPATAFAINRALTELGFSLALNVVDGLARQPLESCLASLSQRFKTEPCVLRERFTRAYRQVPAAHQPPFPGAFELAAWVAGQGGMNIAYTRLGLEAVRDLLEWRQLAALFSGIFGLEEGSLEAIFPVMGMLAGGCRTKNLLISSQKEDLDLAQEAGLAVCGLRLPGDAQRGCRDVDHHEQLLQCLKGCQG